MPFLIPAALAGIAAGAGAAISGTLIPGLSLLTSSIIIGVPSSALQWRPGAPRCPR